MDTFFVGATRYTPASFSFRDAILGKSGLADYYVVHLDLTVEQETEEPAADDGAYAMYTTNRTSVFLGAIDGHMMRTRENQFRLGFEVSLRISADVLPV